MCEGIVSLLTTTRTTEPALIIPGEPVPKDGTYSQNRFRQAETRIAWLATNKWRRCRRCRIVLTIRSYLGTRRRGALPDLECLIRTVKGALRGVLYLEEEQVDNLDVKKSLQQDNPRTEIEWV